MLPTWRIPGHDGPSVYPLSRGRPTIAPVEHGWQNKAGPADPVQSWADVGRVGALWVASPPASCCRIEWRELLLRQPQRDAFSAAELRWFRAPARTIHPCGPFPAAGKLQSQTPQRFAPSAGRLQEAENVASAAQFRGARHRPKETSCGTRRTGENVAVAPTLPGDLAMSATHASRVDVQAIACQLRRCADDLRLAQRQDRRPTHLLLHGRREARQIGGLMLQVAEHHRVGPFAGLPNPSVFRQLEERYDETYGRSGAKGLIEPLAFLLASVIPWLRTNCPGRVAADAGRYSWRTAKRDPETGQAVYGPDGRTVPEIDDYDEEDALAHVRAQVKDYADAAELFAELLTGRAGTHPCRHSKDFTSVVWYGTRYRFNKTQARCVRILWQGWETDCPSVSQETLGEAIGSSSSQFRLRDIFRATSRKGKTGSTRRIQRHAAWGTMIVSDGKGIFRLASPSRK